MKRKRSSNPKSECPTNARTLPDFSNYPALPNGLIYSKLTGKILTPCINSKGYPQVWLKSDSGERRWWAVHRIIGILYVDNPDPETKKFVHHIDNNPKNPAADNLMWVTQRENVQLAVMAGRMGKSGLSGVKGQAHPRFGKKASEQTRAKISASRTGEKNPRFRGYYTYKGVTRASLSLLSQALGLSIGEIRSLNHKGKIKFASKDKSRPTPRLLKPNS